MAGGTSGAVRNAPEGARTAMSFGGLQTVDDAIRAALADPAGLPAEAA